MWPRGTHAEQLATLDDALASVTAQLRTADNPADKAILAQRYDELLHTRLRLVTSAPPSRQGDP